MDEKAQSRNIITQFFNTTMKNNHYQHHNLPIRQTIKMLNKTSGFRFKQAKQSPPKPNSIGRQLYPQVSKKKFIPGPGTYPSDSTVKRSKSFGYIHKQTQLSNRTYKIKKQLSLARIGPGSYHFQGTFDNLSHLRRGNEVKFSPNKIKDRLVFKRNKNPGPGQYQMQDLPKVSKFNNIEKHMISITKRSSILLPDRAPAIGSYSYQKQTFIKQKPKPKIQYKFVYGHAN